MKDSGIPGLLCRVNTSAAATGLPRRFGTPFGFVPERAFPPKIVTTEADQREHVRHCLIRKTAALERVVHVDVQPGG